MDWSHFPLARRTFTHMQTRSHRLAAPLWLPPYTQYTHHNDLAWPTPCWSIYLLHSNLPLGFDSSSFMPLWDCKGTTPCLCVCPTVCPAVSVRVPVLPVRTMAKGSGGDGDIAMMMMMLDHSLKQSQRYFEVAAVVDICSCLCFACEFVWRGSLWCC